MQHLGSQEKERDEAPHIAILPIAAAQRAAAGPQQPASARHTHPHIAYLLLPLPKYSDNSQSTRTRRP